MAIAARETYFMITLMTSGIVVKSSITLNSVIKQIVAFNSPKKKGGYGFVNYS